MSAADCPSAYELWLAASGKDSAAGRSGRRASAARGSLSRHGRRRVLRGPRRIQATSAVARAGGDRGPRRDRDASAHRAAQEAAARRQRARAHPHRAGRGARGLLAARGGWPDAHAGGPSRRAQAGLGGASQGDRHEVVAVRPGSRGSRRHGADAGARAHIVAPVRAGRATREHGKARAQCARVVDARSNLARRRFLRPQGAAARSAAAVARRAGERPDGVTQSHPTRVGVASYSASPVRPRRIPDPCGAFTGRAAAS